MAQERNDREAAHFIAVQSLKNELELAIRLLRGVKEARETVAIETRVIESARSAFKHAVDALNRVPQLSTDDMSTVQRLIDEFRSALSNVER
jgi:hypothetical protein